MGLSASQARLLSITARLSDNELQSQQIANSKVRLADKSQEAGREYIEALDATQLMYNAYDLMGNAVQVNLSAAALYDFSPYKNQYTLVNSNNQLLVSATDVANYQTTNSLEEFLECYDVVDTIATTQLKESNKAQALYSANNDNPDAIGEVVITDKAKAQWYVNLWYRMNGSDTANMVNQLTSEDSSGAFTKTQYTVLMQKKANNTNGYAVLEDNLYRSSDWLQFALEQGIVTIQKATVYDPSEENGKVLSASGEAIMWTRTSHTSCTDFTFVDDEIAIAKAEAEYKRKTDQIQAEDKKLDNDLKKLDTEHNALQTEYESVKSVVSKNIERSFKAFS